jgi:hypothetical protein
MADYIPAPDADFNAWQINFVTYANANLAALGLVAADLTPVTAAQATWATAYPAHVAAVAAAQSAKQAKSGARNAYVAVVRALVRRLQASPSVSDAERASLGITVPGQGGPIPAPNSRPLVAVECGQRLQHTLRFVDENSPTRRAKPDGVLGAEIWAKVGTAPPVNEAELRFVAVDTATPYTLNFESADGGKNAYYWLRWVSPTGQRGPWSEQAAATIAA